MTTECNYSASLGKDKMEFKFWHFKYIRVSFPLSITICKVEEMITIYGLEILKLLTLKRVQIA